MWEHVREVRWVMGERGKQKARGGRIWEEMHFHHHLLEWISCISHPEVTSLTYRLQVQVEKPTAYIHSCKKMIKPPFLVLSGKAMKTSCREKSTKAHTEDAKKMQQREDSAVSGPDCSKPHDLPHQTFLSLPPPLRIDHWGAIWLYSKIKKQKFLVVRAREEEIFSVPLSTSIMCKDLASHFINSVILK